MPSYMPDTAVSRKLHKKLTLVGSAVDGLRELYRHLTEDDAPTLSDEATIVEDFLADSLQNEERVDQPGIQYLPEADQEREFDRRLILRGSEVDAFLLLLEARYLESDEILELERFANEYIRPGKPGHQMPSGSSGSISE